MDSFRSPSAERTLGFPESAGWTHAVAEDKHERRLAFIFLIGLLTLMATAFEASVLGAGGWTPVNIALIVLFLLLFTHVAIGFCQAFFGFLVSIDRAPAAAAQQGGEQNFQTLPVTAIVVPIYNEEVEPVFARLRVMHAALRSLGAVERFQFFVLSDSTDPAKALAEKIAWARFVEETGSAGRVFYRRRALPLNRKSGNIADFCRRWGSQYRYMICLDADSLMSAETLVALVRRMERNHRIGILQTVPQAINGQTIWSRLQQFSMSLYGPIFAAGANFWQQEESNFWGHNAIVRLAPFMQHCALPELPGRNAIGRRPMSHDFVEAALMRRAGWEVRLADDLRGSYEETPPTVIEHLNRDRRWCQGNLQHWPLALARGFKPVTRFHFLHGIFSFIASPLLVLVLVLGFCKNLAPVPMSDGVFADLARAQTALVLFTFTMLLLLLPKFLALGLALWTGRAREFGGAAKMIGSAGAEIICSALIAPVFLFFHAKFVLFSLLGKKVEWHAQQRGCAGGVAWEEAREVFGLTTFFGIIVSAVTWWLTPGYFLWLLPIMLGWLLAIPLTALLGDRELGRAAQRVGLFLVPNELHPAREVRMLVRAARGNDLRPAAEVATVALLDPKLHQVESCLTSSAETGLHRRIWVAPEADLPAVWRRAFAQLELRALALCEARHAV
ncbi:MAG: glucans biosynthesis glucosyltransferase MdoH [Chthoniobacterales bacterium]|nr:glucans biosynthesis glucosyltransferase MdoH [Chthoniobacterales bacterium]